MAIESLWLANLSYINSLNPNYKPMLQMKQRLRNAK